MGVSEILPGGGGKAPGCGHPPLAEDPRPGISSAPRRLLSHGSGDEGSGLQRRRGCDPPHGRGRHLCSSRLFLRLPPGFSFYLFLPSLPFCPGALVGGHREITKSFVKKGPERSLGTRLNLRQSFSLPSTISRDFSFLRVGTAFADTSLGIAKRKSGHLTPYFLKEE